MDSRDNPPENGDADWRQRNRQEQQQRDDRIRAQLQRRQEADDAARTAAQSFTLNFSPDGQHNVVRGTGGGEAGAGVTLSSGGVRYSFNNNNNDDDDDDNDGWITIGSTVANFDNLNMGGNGGNRLGGGNSLGGEGGNHFSVNLGNFMSQGEEGADPHPDDLPIPGEPTVATPRTAAAAAAERRQQQQAETANRPTMQSAFNLNDFFTPGAPAHPDDLPVEGDSDSVGEPETEQPQVQVQQAQNRVRLAGVQVSGQSYDQSGNDREANYQTRFHYRLNENGEWTTVDDNTGDAGESDNAGIPSNGLQMSSDNQGVQIRNVTFSTRSTGASESTGTGGNVRRFVINTGDGADGNFENWINLADHVSGLSQTQIESLPTRKLASRNQEYDCAVCMEAMTSGDVVRTLPCFHQLHVECVDPWLNRKKVCPVCRAEVKFGYEE